MDDNSILTMCLQIAGGLLCFIAGFYSGFNRGVGDDRD